MVEMSSEEHDRHAAGTQFITHTIGRYNALFNRRIDSVINQIISFKLNSNVGLLIFLQNPIASRPRIYSNQHQGIRDPIGTGIDSSNLQSYIEPSNFNIFFFGNFWNVCRQKTQWVTVSICTTDCSCTTWMPQNRWVGSSVDGLFENLQDKMNWNLTVLNCR